MLMVQMDSSGKLIMSSDGAITPAPFLKATIMKLGLYGFVQKAFTPENPKTKLLKTIYKFGGPLEVTPKHSIAKHCTSNV